jgi:hypothetical protein
MKTPHLQGCDPKIKRTLNKPRVSITQWTFTPTAPITVANNSLYNLFSHVQFVEGSAQVVKAVSGDAELFVAVNEAVKSAKFDRVNGDEDVSIRCQIDFSFGGGQTRVIEIALMRPTLTAKVAPFLISRIDNAYPVNASVHQTFAIDPTDNFYVHGVYPQIDNQSGGAMTITKISVLIKRVFEGTKIN